jgi:hypothetical protein
MLRADDQANRKFQTRCIGAQQGSRHCISGHAVMVQWEVENSLLSFDAVDVDLGTSGISFTNQTVVSVTSCLLLCRMKQSEDPLSSSPMKIE